VNVSVSSEAERELIEGAAFYAEHADRELGLAFIAEFEHALGLLSANPEIGPQWRGSTGFRSAAFHTSSYTKYSQRKSALSL
jgi:plasmid stabilization system protein ParE